MSPSEKTVEAFLQGKGRISLSNSSRSSSFSRDQTSSKQVSQSFIRSCLPHISVQRMSIWSNPYNEEERP